MGQKKNLKGTVSIINESGRIRLRWRHQQQRYSINLFHHTKLNLLQAKKIALAIENDMVSDAFDSTLNKYKSKEQVVKPLHQNTVDLFTRWVKEYRNRDADIDTDYYQIKRMFERWGVFHLNEVLSRLNNESIGAKTYNARLRILKGFFRWAIKNRLTEHDPLEDIIPKKITKTPKENRKPFSEKEIMLILEAFRNDTYCPKSSRYRHSFYYPFIYFIFKMGVRPAEGLGLRIKYLDLSNKIVHIKEVLARTVNGSH